MSTYQQRLIAGLTAMGYEQQKNASRYLMFDNDLGDRLFIGQYGALRRGHCASKSHSVGDPQNQTSLYQEVLRAGDHPNLVYWIHNLQSGVVGAKVALSVESHAKALVLQTPGILRFVTRAEALASASGQEVVS